MLQATKAFLTAWLTFIPSILVVFAVWDYQKPLFIALILVWGAAVNLNLAQLNFYRGETQLNLKHDDESAKHYRSGMRYREVAWLFQALSIIVPIFMVLKFS